MDEVVETRYPFLGEEEEEAVATLHFLVAALAVGSDLPAAVLLECRSFRENSCQEFDHLQG